MLAAAAGLPDDDYVLALIAEGAPHARAMGKRLDQGLRLRRRDLTAAGRFAPDAGGVIVFPGVDGGLYWIIAIEEVFRQVQMPERSRLPVPCLGRRNHAGWSSCPLAITIPSPALAHPDRPGDFRANLHHIYVGRCQVERAVKDSSCLVTTFIARLIWNESPTPEQGHRSSTLAIGSRRWTVQNAKGRSSHAWGFALCPANAGNLCRSGEFCRMSVWSTPRNPRAHARGLVSKAAGCVLRKAETMSEREFEFDLIFALPVGGLDEGAILDALHEAGCDDAVVGVGRPGSIGLRSSGPDGTLRPLSSKRSGRPRPRFPRGPSFGRSGLIW